MKKTEEYSEQKDKAYAKMMEASLREIQPKRPISTEQAASTKAIQDRDPRLDSKRVAQLNDPVFWGELSSRAKTLHPSLVERIISPEEYSLIDGMRKKSKNTIGQSDKSVFTPEVKERARQAFTCTPPAALTKQEELKLTELTPIKEYTGPIPAQQKESLWEKFKSKFKSPMPENKSFIEKLDQEEKAKWTIKEKK